MTPVQMSEIISSIMSLTEDEMKDLYLMLFQDARFDKLRRAIRPLVKIIGAKTLTIK